MATTDVSPFTTSKPPQLAYNQRPHIRTVSSSSTAYTGSQGCIDDRDYPSVDLDRDGFENIDLPSAPGRVHTPSPPSRPALGSRLLSSFQNAQPTASALTRSKTILHSRAKSLASFVPKLSPSTAQSTPEGQRQPQHQQSNRLFGDLFSGESAPVRFGIAPTSPSKEKEESEFIMEYKPRFTERPSPRRSMASQTPTQQATKTGWFGRKIAVPATPPPAPVNDELASMNIWTALFPNGPVEELTPHAFNDLLLNASTLLERMQAAYKEKLDYIASIKPEMEVQREEAEEAETRSRHLKMQLEDMSRRALEQETAMQELATQLAEEKLKTHDVKESQTRMVRQVKKSTEDFDEETTPRRRKRASAGNASDSGFESDLDRDTDSSFSPAFSAATPPSMPAPAVMLTPSLDQRNWQKQRELSQRPSFSSSSATAVSMRAASGDANAWATVEKLRGENQGLRIQMEDMQRQVQECIELVAHVRM